MANVLEIIKNEITQDYCHKLYIIECINLIINKEAHLLLTVGNKIVTKKRRNSLSGGLTLQR